MGLYQGKTKITPILKLSNIPLQSKEVVIDSNSETTTVINPSVNYGGMSQVTVDLSWVEENLHAINYGVVEGGGGITPTGTISITENGTYDVTNYASADVNVASGGGILLSVTNLVSGTPRNFYLTLGNNNTWNYDPLSTSIQGSGQVGSYYYYTIVWNIEPNTDYTLFSDDGMYFEREQLINTSENTFLSFNTAVGGGGN